MKSALRKGCVNILVAAWFWTISPLPGGAVSNSERAAGSSAGSGQGAAGVITGKVLFEGTPPKLSPVLMSHDPVCASEHDGPVYPEDGSVNSNGTLPNAFVYVKEGAAEYHLPAPATPAVLQQGGCMYVPHVVGVMVAQPFRVVTSDPTTHNIHVMPRINREWNVSQPPGAPPFTTKFSRPEVMIPVKCNQHKWMKAYVGVVSNPFYVVTGSNGTFTIKDVPPGEYVLEVWTATFGVQQKKVTVRSNETAVVNFSFARK